MKFSAPDFAFPLLSHDKVFNLLKLLDFEAVDLGLFQGRSHLQPSDLRGRASAVARDVRTRLEDRGITVADVFVQPGAHPHLASPNDPDPAVRSHAREIFEEVLEFAAEVGSKHISGLPGVLHEGQSMDDAIGLSAEEMRWRHQAAVNAGLIFGYEPHFGSFCGTPRDLQRMLEAVPEAGLTLDYGHFILQGFSSAEVHPFLSRANHFHARAGSPSELQCLIQANEIDFAGIVSRMAENRYEGFVCVEYVWVDKLGLNRVDNVSEMIQLRNLLSGR